MNIVLSSALENFVKKPCKPGFTTMKMK